MNGLEVFGKSEHEINGVVSILKVFNKDIGIFRIKPCGMFIRKIAA